MKSHNITLHENKVFAKEEDKIFFNMTAEYLYEETTPQKNTVPA